MMLSLVVVLFITVIGIASSNTLYEALSKDSELSEFYTMVNREEVLQILLDRRDVTLFAPTNKALRKWKPRHKDDPKRDDTFSRYYVLNMLANKTMFPLSSTPYLAGVAPLYLGMKEDSRHKEYFVNNAKIIRQNKHRGTEGKEQLMYVIDEVLEPYKPISAQPPTSLQLLKQPSIYGLTEPIDAFASRVTSEREKDVFNRIGNHTFFLPIGSADAAKSYKLQDIDTWVVRGHVIANHVLFLRTMSRKSYKSETWGDNLKVELKLTNDSPKEDEDKWYIQSNTIQGNLQHRKGVVRAKILRPNIPVSNGVVHLISKPLMVIDKTIWEHVEEEKDNRLSQFHSLVSSNPRILSHMKSSDQGTVFAPTDQAFHTLKNVERFQQILANSTATNNLLEMHMVMQPVHSEDVWKKTINSTRTLNNINYLYYNTIGEERNKTLTVEGGGVNATALLGDIGSTNGILHIIDRVLGMPYLTVYNKLAHDPELQTTFKLSLQESWSKKLDDKDKHYTFFVPNQKAWETLRIEMPSEHKQLHLGLFGYHVEKIMDRHLMVGHELTKDDLERKDQVQMVHGTFKISPGRDTALQVEWEGLTAGIVRPDVKATNGIIHVIDRVLMKRRDLTKSGALLTIPSATVLALLLSLVLIKANL